MQPSEEQQHILDALHTGKSVIVDAVAGSGKSTVVLMAAKSKPTRSMLQITYNSMLRKEVQEKVHEWDLQSTLTVHTYHSLAVTFYCPDAHKDEKIQELLERKQTPIRPIPFFDIVVLDEIQDMTLLYFRLVVQFIEDMIQKRPKKRGRPSKQAPRIQLMILGDTMQSLYEFKGADVRFLTHAEEIWTNYIHLKSPTSFIPCSLKTSYRVTQSIAEYVNRVMLGEERLQANKEGGPVKYIYGTSFDNEKRMVAMIQRILDRGYKPDDIFILSGSVKGEYSQVRKIENKLVEKGIPCHVPRGEGRIDEQRVIQGKVVFSTFHSVKGRQRPFVFVLGFDSSYSHVHRCPNTLYVACTRASKEMYLFETETYDNGPLPFLHMDHRTMESQEYIDFVGTSRGPMWYVSRDSHQSLEKQNAPVKKRTIYIHPAKIIEFLSYEVIEQVAPIVHRAFTKKTTDIKEIDIPFLVETGYDQFEDVSDINSIAIPCMFFHTLPSYKPDTLYQISQRLLENSPESQYRFLKTQIHDSMPRAPESTEDFLLAANMYAAVREKLYSKLIQIRRYSWITESQRNECVQRMQEHIEVDTHIEIETDIVSHGDDDKQYLLNQAIQSLFPYDAEFKVSARVDALTRTTLFELKFVNELTIDHFLQVMIYAWIYTTVYPEDVDRTFCLFNIKTNEIYELNTDATCLQEVMRILIQSKYGNDEPASDASFVSQCRNILHTNESISLLLHSCSI